MQNSCRRDIVVIGGSAGGFEALRRLLDLLPSDLPATIFVTLHIPRDFPSVLPELLSRNGKVVRQPSTEQEFSAGQIFIAPPDQHLVIQRSRVVLGKGPRENRHRPAIDVMFRSAARAYGPRVVAIVLSGQLDDGSVGMLSVKMGGGLTVAQDPHEALAPDMPEHAIRYAQPDFVLPVSHIAELLVSVSSENLPLPNASRKTMSAELNKNKLEPSAKEVAAILNKGKPSAFACPECHGVLWEIENGDFVSYRCRVGHAYTGETLRVALSETAENALWVALRVVEEKAALLRRLARKTGSRISGTYEEEAAGFELHAATLRRLLSANHARVEGELDAA
jgi:two-component system chemotaxis response regulator CheB